MSELIRGNPASMFWASDDSEAVYEAYPVTMWKCGKCGQNLEKGHWVCSQRHKNTPTARTSQ